MAHNRSFKEYIANRFYNELHAAIEEYVADNVDSLDLRLYEVRTIGDIELSEIDVKFVSVSDLPGSEIAFDAAVEAELYVRERDYHYDDSEECRQWFMVKCRGDLDCSLDDFSISSVSVYGGKGRNAAPLSDALVPVIHKEDLEQVAEQFLKDHYPKALLQPMAVDPKELAENMGLTVDVRNITKDCSVFGQIFFHDCTSEFYDKETDGMVGIDVKAGTIFVDPETYFLYNLGKVNNTIVHECVHWDKHRKAFELERLYNSDACQIRCRAVGGVADNSRDATEWMEWQANSLAPRIQMPLAMFKTQASKYIREIRQETGKYDLIDIIEPVIESMSVFFGVSRLAAKIRMVDAGYEEAIGAFIYMDGRYVAPHRFRKGAIRPNQTFSIGAEDAAIQSLTNQKLRKLTEDGSYQYVDSHFVFNHPKYLIEDANGITVLTEYARNHMEECCLAEGGDIYCATAERMFHCRVVKHGENGELRQKGKQCELSCGYGGSVGALKAMGALEAGMQEDELKPLVDAWRSANPKIVEFWWDVDRAVMKTVREHVPTRVKNIRFAWRSGMLFITLPSGRQLAYVKPRIGENQFGGDCVTYMGVGGTKKWERLESYGPKFVENIVQAISRDILMYAMKTLRFCSIVAHVHDELIIEADKRMSLDAVCEQMGRTPPWAEGLLLRADGYETDFYKKD